MSKYLILAILNLPFIIFGIVNAFIRYKEQLTTITGLLVRLIFWSIAGTGVIFAEAIYNFLIGNNLTDSAPLSLADVVLVTGVSFCLFLCIRLYTRAEHAEQRMSELHERLSIMLSEKK